MASEVEFQLSEEQEAVVAAQRGPLLVLAPVGSGKTWVMARRLARAIQDGLEPERCLSLTFTNRAARELRERVSRLEGRAAQAPVMTFHSFCAHLLREECAEAGLPRDFSILDELDSLQALEKARPDNVDPNLKAGDFMHRLGRRLSALDPEACTIGAISAKALNGLDGDHKAWLGAYLGALKQSACLDFTLLVHQARALLAQLPELRARWAARYRWVQVDEVQDTHLSEWSLLEVLASAHGNLAFFGDLDQTIYGWRGSQPARLLEAFRAALGDPLALSLETNHRGTRAILDLAGHVADGLPDRHTRLNPSPALPQGDPVRWILADTPAVAARQVARDLAGRCGRDGGGAVLARSGATCRQIASELEREGLTPLLEEDLRLARRPEVKALLAPLRLVANGEDLGALRHWLAWGGPHDDLRASLERIQPHARDSHLALTDLVRLDVLRRGDPFADLLDAWEGSHHVVLDIESTGLDAQVDEVVEIACQRWARNVELDRLHLLLKPSRPLDESASVHGLDEALLRREGRPPAQALTELADYVGASLVVGHNVGFDLGMLHAQASRLGVRLSLQAHEDTLRLARRVLRTGSMRLGELATRLSLRTEPTHRAMDDVGATQALLEALLPAVVESREDRRDLVTLAVHAFSPWAEALEKLRALSRTLRPAELITLAAGEAWYKQGLRGQDLPRAVERLARWARQLDEDGLSHLPPQEALRAVLEQTALARPVDLLEEGAVPVLTIHAAKGMEFDQVWLVGLCQGVLPDFRNQRGEGLAEERRVCYVGITRARKTLCCVAWREDGRGRPVGWSEFVKGVAPHAT